MRSDHHLNLLSQQRVQLCLVEFSSCTDRWRCWFVWIPTWWSPFLLSPDTSPKRGRSNRPGTDCWMLIRSMRAGLSRLLPWSDTKMWARIGLRSRMNNIVDERKLTNVDLSLLLLKNEQIAPQTLSLTSTMSWMTCSYSFSWDPLQFSALKMNLETNG